MSEIRKNGKSYDSGDVTVSLLGYAESEVKSITYGDEQEHQLNHSLQNKATSYGMGKISPSASVELYMTAVVKLEKIVKAASGSTDLKLLKPFQIDVTFTNEDNDLINDSIWVKFKNRGRTVNGDMGLAQSFELFCMDVDFNNA